MQLLKKAKHHMCWGVGTWKILKKSLSSSIEATTHAEGGDSEEPHAEIRDLIGLWRYLEFSPNSRVTLGVDFSIM